MVTPKQDQNSAVSQLIKEFKMIAARKPIEEHTWSVVQDEIGEDQKNSIGQNYQNAEFLQNLARSKLQM